MSHMFIDLQSFKTKGCIRSRFWDNTHWFFFKRRTVTDVDIINSMSSYQFSSEFAFHIGFGLQIILDFYQTHTLPKVAFMVILSTWFCILMARKKMNIRSVPSFSGAEKQLDGSVICVYLCIYAIESQTSLGNIR